MYYNACCATAYIMTPESQSGAILPSPPAHPSDEDFLRALGSRVRELRSRRGMTRKMMAQESDVSERHLAQLELGDGNVSIVLLRRIATALNVSLADLFTFEGPASDAKRSILDVLERLPMQQLSALAARLTKEFGATPKDRHSRIALIGLRGAGKSTLGVKLAQAVKAPFIELDREIAKEAGMDLSEIFSLYGQSGYRRIEQRVLERILGEYPRAVLSVGGGVVSEKETYDRLLGSCFTVWVKASPEDYMARVMAQGDFRAMAENDEAMEDLRHILDAREPFYRKADLHLDTAGESAEQSFLKLRKALQTEIG
jgi:XRE family transcriptional regulator, aerobic/anaerobic benzoate catabolism transcriptional regulator